MQQKMSQKELDVLKLIFDVKSPVTISDIVAKKPEELQQVLHYTFKNPALLRIALTHTSFANESKVATTHNERLEFLGDSILGMLVAEYLYRNFPDRPEGELTRMRADMVCEKTLAGVTDAAKSAPSRKPQGSPLTNSSRGRMPESYAKPDSHADMLPPEQTHEIIKL